MYVISEVAGSRLADGGLDRGGPQGIDPPQLSSALP